ncbi:MAG: NAD(P)/FAD-dependent oxidoreductase [Pseudomonadota bacterium]
MAFDPEIEALVGEYEHDPQALARRYLEERDKRLHPDKNDQYLEVTADFSNYVNDPYVASTGERTARTEDTEILIIGGGFGGILCAARLKEQGFQDMLVVEKGGDFGGCWYWNRYPGIRCDTESYVYMPLLEELGYIPSEKYARGSEIRAHIVNVAKHFELYQHACFQTEVKGVKWIDAEQHWLVTTDRGDCFRARFVVMANGPLDRPKLPGIAGINEFAGHTFHTSRWDYAYTEGNFKGGLTGLADKTVGVIGTGATGVQCIPLIAESAQHLYVFQRTPAAVDHRNNRPTDDRWASALTPGWQAARKDNFNHWVTGAPMAEDLIDDGWTKIGRLLDPTASWAIGQVGRPLTQQEGEYISDILDDKSMNGIREWIDEVVDDQEVAEQLKPWHRRWCKRPLFHDEYYPTFNRNNVTLVDSHGQGVERVTETGVVVDGIEYKVDCLIFATGFEVGTEYSRRAGYDVIGRNGLALGEYWSNGMRTLNGMNMRHFPNCFYIGFGQNANATNFCFILDEQAQHAAHIIAGVRDRGATSVEPNEDAIDAYLQEVQPMSISQLKFWVDCTPSYMNGEGDNDDPNGFFANLHPAGTVGFYNKLREWREEGSLLGLDVR